MEEIDLTPNWENVAKFMATVLKSNGFETEHAKYEFSTQYSEVLGYLRNTNPEAYMRCRQFGNDLADGMDVKVVDDE